MILLDEPTWPAHGRLWGHLVSDASLAELIRFARAAGLPDRGFDHDHYDYPAERREDLLARGAVAVPSSDLLRRLRAAGLRLRPAVRTPSRPHAHALVTDAWAGLLPQFPRLRDDLLGRWAEPHRRYHDVRHLASCLIALEALGHDDPLTHLAAWFHDACHDGSDGDEEASARLATQALAGHLPPASVAEVSRLVRLTATHDPAPGDARGAALVDADLSVLGAPAGRYLVYARDVAAEYAHVPPDSFRSGRAAILERLLDRPALYATVEGRRLWEDAARSNLADELTALRGGPGGSAAIWSHSVERAEPGTVEA